MPLDLMILCRFFSYKTLHKTRHNPHDGVLEFAPLSLKLFNVINRMIKLALHGQTLWLLSSNIF